MSLPLIVNKIRTDGPLEGLGNSFGKVRNNGITRHKGWDLSAEPNSPVFAVANGPRRRNSTRMFSRPP